MFRHSKRLVNTTEATQNKTQAGRKQGRNIFVGGGGGGATPTHPTDLKVEGFPPLHLTCHPTRPEVPLHHKQFQPIHPTPLIRPHRFHPTSYTPTAIGYPLHHTAGPTCCHATTMSFPPLTTIHCRAGKPNNQHHSHLNPNTANRRKVNHSQHACNHHPHHNLNKRYH